MTKKGTPKNLVRLRGKSGKKYVGNYLKAYIYIWTERLAMALSMLKPLRSMGDLGRRGWEGARERIMVNQGTG